MKDLFVPSKQSRQLKELGFNEPCLAFYNTKVDESISFVDLFGFLDEKIIDDYYYNKLGLYVSAPTFSQAFRWFREKYGLGHMINGIGYESFIMNIGGMLHIFNAFDFKTYEEAELACLTN